MLLTRWISFLVSKVQVAITLRILKQQLKAETVRGAYILDGVRPIPCGDLIKWAEYMAKADRHVARTEQNGILVSTVFLGLDHNFNPEGPPILFETMVFGHKEHDGLQWRYATYSNAVNGHREICEKVFECLNSKIEQPWG